MVVPYERKADLRAQVAIDHTYNVVYQFTGNRSLEMSGYFRPRLGEYEYFIPQSNYDIRVTLMGKIPSFFVKY